MKRGTFGKDMEFPGDDDQLASKVRIDIGGIDHGEFSKFETSGNNVIEELEGFIGNALIVFVIGNDSPADVRGNHFRGEEVVSGKGGLPGSGRADQEDE